MGREISGKHPQPPHDRTAIFYRQDLAEFWLCRSDQTDFAEGKDCRRTAAPAGLRLVMFQKPLPDRTAVYKQAGGYREPLRQLCRVDGAFRPRSTRWYL